MENGRHPFFYSFILSYDWKSFRTAPIFASQKQVHVAGWDTKGLLTLLGMSSLSGINNHFLLLL